MSTPLDLPMTVYHRFQQIYVLLDDGDRRSLQPLDLTPTQFNLLLRLGDDVTTGLTITELAGQLLCTRGNITRLVRRMEEQGLVQTGPDASDQRLVRVALTETGRARREAASTAHIQAVERRLAGLSPAAQQQLAELTRQLVDALTTDLAQQALP